MMRLINENRVATIKYVRWILVLVFCLPLMACIPQKPTQRWQLATQGAYSASMDKQGYSVVLGSFQHGGSYWTVDSNAREFNWNHRDGYLTEILFSDISDDLKFAMTANYYNLVLWNAQTGRPVWFWSAPARIDAADLSADGRFVLLGLDNNKAVLFDAQNGGILREFMHEGPVVSVSLHVKSGRALTGSEDRTAKLWNLRNAQLIKTVDYSNQVSVLEFSDSGRFALIVPSNEKAEIWDLQENEKITRLSTAKFRIYSALFIDEDRLLVGTTHRNIFEYNIHTGKKLNTWQIGTEGKQAFKSAIVLDVAMREAQVVYAIGSNGYLYQFE